MAYQLLNALIGAECADWFDLLQQGLEEGLPPNLFKVGVAQLVSNHAGEELVISLLVEFDPIEVCSHIMLMKI